MKKWKQSGKGLALGEQAGSIASMIDCPIPVSVPWVSVFQYHQGQTQGRKSSLSTRIFVKILTIVRIRVTFGGVSWDEGPVFVREDL